MSMTPDSTPPPLEIRFTVYEPFDRPAPGGIRHFVLYAHRSDGSRRRAGALDLKGPDAEAFLELWAASGAKIATREDLGLPSAVWAQIDRK